MSFFKKLAASAGIGAAKVDTVLHKSKYSPGEMVSGTVRVKGGSIEQQIRHIEVIVKTKYNIQEDDKAETKYKTVASHRVTNEFMINAGEEKVFSFSCRLPLDTPVTIGKTNVFLMTDLDIEGGIDQTMIRFTSISTRGWTMYYKPCRKLALGSMRRTVNMPLISAGVCHLCRNLNLSRIPDLTKDCSMNWKPYFTSTKTD